MNTNDSTKVLLSVDKQNRESQLAAVLSTGYDVWPTSPMSGKYLVSSGEYKPAVAIIEIGYSASATIEAIEELRKFRSFAIIALVDDEQDDEYHLLQHIGVDACLTREVFTPILLEKVAELITAKAEEVKTSFTAGPVWLDPDTKRAKVDSRDVRLTDDEFALVHELAGEPFSFNGKEELVRSVLGIQAIGSSDVRRLERVAKSLREARGDQPSTGGR